jgi:hypothetical protein
LPAPFGPAEKEGTDKEHRRELSENNALAFPARLLYLTSIMNAQYLYGKSAEHAGATLGVRKKFVLRRAEGAERNAFGSFLTTHTATAPMTRRQQGPTRFRRL